jgi:hypothetical protein
LIRQCTQISRHSCPRKSFRSDLEYMLLIITEGWEKGKKRSTSSAAPPSRRKVPERAKSMATSSPCWIHWPTEANCYQYYSFSYYDSYPRYMPEPRRPGFLLDFRRIIELLYLYSTVVAFTFLLEFYSDLTSLWTAIIDLYYRCLHSSFFRGVTF